MVKEENQNSQEKPDFNSKSTNPTSNVPLYFFLIVMALWFILQFALHKSGKSS